MASLALAFAGCKPAPTLPPDPVGQAPLHNGRKMELVKGPASRPSDRYILMVGLRLIPVEVPIGTISNSRRFWDYLDEKAPGADMAATLNRNGLRVGRGKAENWEPVSRLLREMTGKAVNPASYLTPPDRPIFITVKLSPVPQTIFTLDSQGHLSGADYPIGEDLLLASCRVNEDDPSVILFHAVPMVRSAERKTKVVENEQGEFSMLPIQEGFSIPLLEFKIPLPQGSFLAIGPSAQAGFETSPGRQFLVKDRQGLQYETLLVIVPAIFSAEK